MAGTLVWNVPGCQVEIEREEVYPNKIDTAESAFEVRTNWSATPKYKYRFTIIGRTAAATNEVATIVNLYESNRGTWDTFSMTDPVDGASRAACRFSGPLKLRRLLPTGTRGAWWEMKIECETVSNPS